MKLPVVVGVLLLLLVNVSFLVYVMQYSHGEQRAVRTAPISPADFVSDDMDQTLHHQMVVARRCQAERDHATVVPMNLDLSVIRCLLHLMKPRTILKFGQVGESVEELVLKLQNTEANITHVVVPCNLPCEAELKQLLPNDMILIGTVEGGDRKIFSMLLPLIPADVIVGFLNADSDPEWSLLVRIATGRMVTAFATAQLQQRYPAEMSKLLPRNSPWGKRLRETARSLWTRTPSEHLCGGIPHSWTHVLHYQFDYSEEASHAWGGDDLDTHIWEDGLVGGPYPSRIVGTGKAWKVVNGPIFSTGRGFINKGGDAKNPINYRILSLRWKIDYSQLLPDESVESDVCLTVLPVSVQNSQSSGDEILCTHEYVTAKGPFRETNQVFPLGGFVLKPGYKAVIAGVSNIYPTKDFNVEPHSSRFLKNQKEFLALEYRMEMVREDLVPLPALTSVRSPFRDRSFNSAMRPFAPYTDFKNVANRPVHVYGIGVFLSALSHHTKLHHILKIYINDEMVYSKHLPDHDPRHTSERATHIHPFDAILPHGTIISVRCSFESQTSHVSDFAGFILSDAEEGHLIKTNEVQIMPGKIDVNNDGVFDNIDFDAMGSIWVEQSAGRTDGEENHDTQFEWIGSIFNYAAPLGVNREAIHDFISFPGDRGPEKPYLVIRDPEWTKTGHGLCMNIFIKEPSGFDVEYCRQTVPVPHTTGGWWYRDMVVWGDFNGDGYPDRVRIDHPKEKDKDGKLVPVPRKCENVHHCDDDRALKKRYIAFGGPDGMIKEEGWRRRGDNGPWADPMCLTMLFASPEAEIFKRDWLIFICPQRSVMKTMLFDPQDMA